MVIDEKDLYAIKEQAIEYYSELKYYYNRPDERMLLSYCYTKSIVDVLKKKGLDVSMEVTYVKK
jgi:hypothetical protein